MQKPTCAVAISLSMNRTTSTRWPDEQTQCSELDLHTMKKFDRSGKGGKGGGVIHILNVQLEGFVTVSKCAELQWFSAMLMVEERL